MDIGRILKAIAVIIDPSNRLRAGLVRSNPEAAALLSPTYLKLFKNYLLIAAAEEARNAEDECSSS